MLRNKRAPAGALVSAAALMAVWAADTPLDVKTVVGNSMKAMGADGVKTLVISGEGFESCVGQEPNWHTGWWRRYSDKQYVRSVDFDARAWRVTRLRGEGEPNGHGGCGTTNPTPEAQQTQVTNLSANPNTPWNTRLDYILLPEGFLKTALEKNATVKFETIKGKKFTVVEFMGDNKAPVDGYINDQGYVEKVETKIDINPFGDQIFNAIYTDWKDFGAVKFPAHILENQGETSQGPIKYFELNVTDVKVNAPVDLTVPGGRGGRFGGAGGRAAPAVASEDLTGGFWLVTGGYGSVIANFKDYIVVIEGPSNEMRAEQIISQAKLLVPNKPIKYVINTHAHTDHSGGLRRFVAEGATIVTSQVNKGYYEHMLKYPHTLAPDKMQQMNPQPKIKVEYVGESKKMSDGEHEIDIYHVDNSMHADDMLMIYLPKQKILIEADEFNVPPAPLAAPAPNPNNYQTNLLANIERLKLDVARIIPVHLPNDNRKVALSELKMAAGKAN
ncbi:MAG TPA: MBL fold metallo-hydrolase [Bryobacteraceae bacterium]|nr:MBL fold metallo-hydrolase [Bryobacteraceae bacterium]